MRKCDRILFGALTYGIELVIRLSSYQLCNVREHARTLHIEGKGPRFGDRTVSRGAQLDSDLVLADVYLFNWEIESESTNIGVIVECDTSQP